MEILLARQPKRWLFYTALNILFTGIWGAFIEIPEKAGFPATLGYIVWSLTMLPVAAVLLFKISWRLEYSPRAIFLGMVVGVTGAGGQLLLFEALRKGPAFIIFPLITLFPVLTIILSVLFLKEKGSRRQWTGVVIALIAACFLSFQPPQGSPVQGIQWFLLSLAVFVLWGIQGYAMKFANQTMQAESIFFYMALAGVLLAPFAWHMTDFSQHVNWGWKGPYLAALIHVLNAVGVLSLVYALRYGKAVIVMPLTSLASVMTVVLSLMIYNVVPGMVLGAGIILALVAIALLSE